MAIHQNALFEKKNIISKIQNSKIAPMMLRDSLTMTDKSGLAHQ